jgi:transposase
MAKKHPRAYPLEFRHKVVELARAGRRVDELAVEFQLGTQTIRNWLKQTDLDAGRRTDGLTTEERTELSKLRRENKRLTIKNEILSKAAGNSTDQRNISFSLLAGVLYCKVLRGRWFSLSAMRLRSA